MDLTTIQLAAIKHIEEYASTTDTIGKQELANVLAMSNISPERFAEAVRRIKLSARIGLQFHPDRISRNGTSVIASLIDSGLYKNQFETHLSNGGLDPFEGGLRAGFEDRVFGGVFTANRVPLSERPKYGALDLMLFPDGPCPRYGSCYFLTNAEVAERCTFTYMDSYRNPHEKGTLKVFEPIMAALMTECFERRFALGKHSISPAELIDHLGRDLQKPFEDPARFEPGRNLNHYIEAQVHGEISFRNDIEILVADPSFKETPIAEAFYRLCDNYGIDLFFHRGFRLSVDRIPDDFRGPTMPSLGKRISRDGYVDPFCIGIAAADLKRDPKRWANRGPYDVVLQEIKLLWHVLVQYGEGAAEGAA